MARCSTASRTRAAAPPWTNAFLNEVPEKRKVAETLKDYQRAHLYNRYDLNVQRFSAEVPQIWQWDDHEVTNNWSDAKVLPAAYTEQRIQTLVGNATRAFLDYAPMRPHSAVESERVYRHIPYGRDLDVFVLDMRSYRGPNSYNRQTRPGDDTDFLGQKQLAWLKRKLKDSCATWKVIAADMPIGLLVPDGNDAQGRARFEAIANGDGPVLGREFEIADLLALHQARRHRQHRVDHRRRALLRGSLLRPGQGAVPRLRSFLGICRGPAECRRVRAPMRSTTPSGRS